MLNYARAFYDLKNRLQPLYDEREAVAITHELLHHITGLDKGQRLMRKGDELPADQQAQYELCANALLAGKPLQYVLNSAWFMGREFFVNEHVLIPRPETEELVQWITDDCKTLGPAAPHILDVGTGSGCIPISLKLAMPGAKVSSCDISAEALGVAKINAERLAADVELTEADFLNKGVSNNMGVYHVIVSNPPYIPVAERERLHANVRDHEPGVALFVPDDDALVFYKAIAAFGRGHLADGGHIYCELDAGHARQCKALFEIAEYSNVTLKQDMHGNWRMLKADK